METPITTSNTDNILSNIWTTFETLTIEEEKTKPKKQEMTMDIDDNHHQESQSHPRSTNRAQLDTKTRHHRRQRRREGQQQNGGVSPSTLLMGEVFTWQYIPGLKYGVQPLINDNQLQFLVPDLYARLQLSKVLKPLPCNGNNSSSSNRCIDGLYSNMSKETIVKRHVRK